MSARSRDDVINRRSPQSMGELGDTGSKASQQHVVKAHLVIAVGFASSDKRRGDLC